MATWCDAAADMWVLRVGTFFSAQLQRWQRKACFSRAFVVSGGPSPQYMVHHVPCTDVRDNKIRRQKQCTTG